MANSHVAHDCQVGTDVNFANNATNGGHVSVGDYVFLGGLSAVHQFTRIGSQVMIAGASAVAGDVIPFAIVDGGFRPQLRGLNVIGLRRRGFSAARLLALRAFYQFLFLGPGLFADRLAAAAEKPAADPGITEIIEFCRTTGKRPLTMAKPLGADDAET
jgi:UDP-N-acetylglucosamine acyltransferase